MSSPYQLYFEVAKEVALEAGAIIKEAFERFDSIVEYKSSIDLVTDTDKKVETHVINRLREKFPETEFLAEESASAQGGYVFKDAPTWVIDPVDGTTNFVHRIPICCVSIALAINREAVVGIVYNPILDELFTAIKDGGSFLNGKQLKVSQVDDLSRAVVGTNVGYIRSPSGVDFMLANLRTLLVNNVQSIRKGGSAAWEVSSVGCGRLDAFYEFGIHPWDIAAAGLIVTEAGGVVVDPSGDKLKWEKRRILCGNKKIVDILSSLIKSPEQ